MEYGISTILFKNPFNSVLEEISLAGFKYIEVYCDQQLLSFCEDINKAKTILHQLGLEIKVAHCKFKNLWPDDPDDKKRMEAVGIISSDFEMLSELGVDVIVVHIGRFRGDVCKELYTTLLKSSKQTIIELGCKADNYGLKLAVENLSSCGGMTPLSSVAEILDVIDGLDENIGICLDTGHAFLNNLNPANEARLAGGKLFTLHIHDNNCDTDKHLLPGLGKIDWDAFRNVLDNEMNFIGSRIFELDMMSGLENQMLKKASELASKWS